jgi:hypothetical protein
LTPSGTEPWTIQPTRIERQYGRLMRSPEGDDGQQIDDKSLVNEDNKADDQKAEDQKADNQKVEDQKVEDKVEDKKPDDQKVEDQQVEPVTVEQLTVPEGFTLEPELATDFLKIVNDGEMDPKDKANALIALHGKTISAALEADSTAWDNMQTEWKEAAKADPDVGGAKLQPALTNIGKLLDEFGDKETRGVFDLTGAGNNVHMIKFLNKIADTLVEGKFFKARSPSGQDDPDAAAKRLYPTMKG